MAYTLKLKCPDCGETFRAVVDTDEDLPNFCAECGSYCGGDPDFVPSQVNIGSNLGKAADMVYRAIEAGGEARAEMAGDPAQKITNLQNTLRQGDVAGMPVNNTVTQFAETSGHNYFGGAAMGGIDAGSVIAMAKQGKTRTTGAVALEAIQDRSGDLLRVPTVAGMKAKFGA